MISVIVPVYKVEKYLNKCVESILGQSYLNLEIILVDDGSPDKCGEICDRYAERDKRVKVIHKKNGGVSSARNAGLKIAKGDYISFIDSDDWIDRNMYEELIKIAMKTDADIVEGGYRFWRPWKVEKKTLNGLNTCELKVYTNVEALNELYFGPQRFGGITIMVWNKLYKASLIHDVTFFEGYMNEDLEFTPRILFYAKKIVKYEKDFYTYNIHLGSDSTSGMKNTIWKLESNIIMHKRVMDFFQEHMIDNISFHTAGMYWGG